MAAVDAHYGEKKTIEHEHNNNSSNNRNKRTAREAISTSTAT